MWIKKNMKNHTKTTNSKNGIWCKLLHQRLEASYEDSLIILSITAHEKEEVDYLSSLLEKVLGAA